jgi:drug/metabolite transporter (DMT)-like permease
MTKAMNTKFLSMMLVIISTLFIGVTQVLFKIASNQISFNLIALLRNQYLLFGIIFSIISFFLLTLALKFGELSAVYPMMGLSYVWVILLSHYFLKDIINLQKLLGILTILVGITFIGFGSKK